MRLKNNVAAVKVKRIIQWIGSSLGLIGVAFVLVKLTQYSNQIPLHQLGIASWILLLALAIIYGFSGLLLALAWRDLLQYFGVSVHRRWAIWAYGLSQLAKYMPGNIFHLAGRQAIGFGAGIANWPLAKSSFWELAAISMTGGLFGLLTLPLITPSLHGYLAVLLFATVLSAVLLISSRTFGSLIAWTVSKYAVFLTVSGLAFTAVLALIASPDRLTGSNIPMICGAYVIAWLAGLVTPGAPAGVGVREIVMYALLHTLISQSDLLTAIVLARIVTVAGDLLFYLLALVFFKSSNFDKIKTTESACD